MIPKELRKYLESEKKDASIFDIIVFGSSAKGKAKPNDIDILLIFRSGSQAERLDKLSDIKQRARRKSEDDLHMSQILLEEMFSSSFFARTGILVEGLSIFRQKSFAETLGLKAYSLFSYNLKELNHTEKVKFNYVLAGRGSQGMIKEMNGIRLSNGSIKIPIENSIPFEQILKANRISYIKSNILEEK